MENEGRIAELLPEALLKLDTMIVGQQESNQRLEHVERELNKLNLQTVENTRAIFKLADRVDNIAELDKGLKELEKVVYK